MNCLNIFFMRLGMNSFFMDYAAVKGYKSHQNNYAWPCSKYLHCHWTTSQVINSNSVTILWLIRFDNFFHHFGPFRKKLAPGYLSKFPGFFATGRFSRWPPPQFWIFEFLPNHQEVHFFLCFWGQRTHLCPYLYDLKSFWPSNNCYKYFSPFLNWKYGILTSAQP